jgi:hypothetical protein
MRGLQAGCDLRDQVHRRRGTEGAAGQPVRQGRPVDQLHDQVGLPVGGLPVVVDPRDVLVGQRSGVPGLGLEPGQGLALRGVPGVEQLDRDRTRQHGIGGAPHLAVPARADWLIKDVTTVKQRRGIDHLRPVPEPPDFNHRGMLGSPAVTSW